MVEGLFHQILEPLDHDALSNRANYVRELMDETALDGHVYGIVVVQRTWKLTYHVAKCLLA